MTAMQGLVCHVGPDMMRLIAEKVGGVPRARQTVEDGRLPGEVVRVGRRGLELVFERRHFHYVIAHGKPVQSGASAAHARQRLDLLLWICLLQRRNVPSCQSPAPAALSLAG